MTVAPAPPEPDGKSGRPDVEGDKRRLWDVVVNGGIAIVPSNVGYGIWGGSSAATRRIIETKRRGTHKRQGMVMGSVTERELHIVNQRQRDIIDCVTKDFDLPLGVIARYDTNHPLMAKVDPYLKSVGTAQGTISTALNAGHFQDSIGLLSHDHCHPIFASSANLTGTGVKYQVQDIESEILDIADIVLDYGLCRYHTAMVSSTQINFETMQVTRMGSCYELISDILKRYFKWELPPDPGRELNRSGIVQEFALSGLA